MAGALNDYINNPRSNDRANNQNVVILLLVGPSDNKARSVKTQHQGCETCQIFVINGPAAPSQI